MISTEEVDIKRETTEEYDVEFNDIEFEAEPVYSDEKDEEETEDEEEFNPDESKQRKISVHILSRDKTYKKTKNLIELVKSCPMLYDYRHESYKNYLLKNRKWKKIAETIEEESVHMAKTKWKSLRDTYIKYLRGQKLKNKTGSKKKNSYRRWRWEHLMSFLQPFLEPQTVEVNISSHSKYNNQKLTSQSHNNNQKFTSQSQNNNHILKSQSHNNQKLTLKWQNNNHKLTSRSQNNNHKVPSQLQYNEQKLRHNQEAKVIYDSTDLLFLGHAKALKKLSQRIQAKAKAKIAIVIKVAEAEFDLERSNYRKSRIHLQRPKREQKFEASGVSKITDPLLLTPDVLSHSDSE